MNKELQEELIEFVEKRSIDKVYGPTKFAGQGQAPQKQDELLPDCMMPDGAEPCKGYHQLQAKLAEAEKRANNYLDQLNEMHRKFDKYEVRDRERLISQLTHRLDRLELLSITFLARARENCAELNPNNYNSNSALWKADAELGRYLEALKDQGE